MATLTWSGRTYRGEILTGHEAWELWCDLAPAAEASGAFRLGFLKPATEAEQQVVGATVLRCRAKILAHPTHRDLVKRTLRGWTCDGQDVLTHWSTLFADRPGEPADIAWEIWSRHGFFFPPGVERGDAPSASPAQPDPATDAV